MARDRIAPNCTIRHPVLQIVALQRRVRFSARLAGFSRIRWHQRRARRAERASFSDLVSNLDFRGTSSRQRRERAANRALRQRKRGHPSGPESRPGLPRCSWPSTFWSRCAWASLMSLSCSRIGPQPGSRSHLCLQGSSRAGSRECRSSPAARRPVLPLLSVGEMTLRLYGAFNYSQNSVRNLRCALNGA